MARKKRVRIEGLAELQISLRQLKDTTAKGVLRRVGRQVLEPVAVHARSLVREDTGTLKHSIGVSTKLTGPQRRKRVKPDRDDVEIYVGAGGLSQAITEEYGTPDQSPHPFMRPAWDGNKARVAGSIRETLAKEVQKSAERAARKKAKAKS